MEHVCPSSSHAACSQTISFSELSVVASLFRFIFWLNATFRVSPFVQWGTLSPFAGAAEIVANPFSQHTKTLLGQTGWIRHKTTLIIAKSAKTGIAHARSLFFFSALSDGQTLYSF
jgi:hypothetical protein